MEKTGKREIKENDGSKKNQTDEEKEDVASFKCAKLLLLSKDITHIPNKKMLTDKDRRKIEPRMMVKYIQQNNNNDIGKAFNQILKKNLCNVKEENLKVLRVTVYKKREVEV